MAYPVNTNDIVEVTYSGSLFGQIVMNVLHYKYTGPAAIPDGEGAMQFLLGALAVANQLRDKLTSAMCVQAQLIEERAQVVWPQRKPYSANGIAINGTDAGTCTAPNYAASIQKFPDQAGRGRAGSFHVYGGPIEQQTAGRWNVIELVTLNLLADKIATTYALSAAGNNAAPVVWSRVRPNNPSNVLRAFAHTQVRTMHRRTVGLGI